MTAKVLVVDDVQINLRLMEIRLQEEYYEVRTAGSGQEAIAICQAEPIDIVLLDVMMPGMDGYETCRRIKADPATHHIPVVLVTALDGAEDRVTGLESGADDFLVKPVRDLPLFSRIRSLTRLKMLTDELRVRAQTTLAILSEDGFVADVAGTDGSIVLIEENPLESDRLTRMLRGEQRVTAVGSLDELSAMLASGSQPDLVIADLASRRHDALRLCSRLRSDEATRQLPILVIAPTDEEKRVARALELGVNDYLVRPIDRNELLARVRTQVKRRRYSENLRRSLQETIELATIDPLTGLHNRRFLDGHLPKAVERSRQEGKALSVLVVDIDHFKQINDRHGHDVGDEVLREFAVRLRESLRASDLACRLGGEEFVLLLPDTDSASANVIAERLRLLVSTTAIAVGDGIRLTISAGCATLGLPDTDATLLKRADMAVYAAKHNGRNRVVTLAA
ncbi:PleD family two-component system response regulator [Aureimonas sp. AU4]|uniref:PleD family two-component system response regulator n=1 Tax=Aureimonas sp. AU4 TaxID=1638163 RepID=UPI00070660CF|nr:PleD family two-component system response regulator [Aureimonas sp. AU4]BAT30734.1 pole remodelling regulatory diguanylate cyclase [Aureimonas sp. AU4]